MYANMQLVRHPRFTRLLTQLQIPATAAAAPLARQPNSSSPHHVLQTSTDLSTIACSNAAAQRTAATAAGEAHASAATAMPVVYHPLYSAPQLAPGHRFPMQVFGRIYERLLQQKVITDAQVLAACIVTRRLPATAAAAAHCDQMLTCPSNQSAAVAREHCAVHLHNGLL